MQVNSNYKCLPYKINLIFEHLTHFLKPKLYQNFHINLFRNVYSREQCPLYNICNYNYSEAINFI